MRPLALAFLILVVGCSSAPVGKAPSSGSALEAEAEQVLSGLDDKRTYYGRFKDLDGSGQELGDCMLVLCGCKCWRVLVSRDDGSLRTQFLVHFAPTGTEGATTEVTMSGEADGGTLTGTVDQAAGLAEGRVLFGPYALVFAANRTDKAPTADTCTRCHWGDDPVWPLPAAHPESPAAAPGCLDCHPLDF